MKKLFIILLSLILTISLFGCTSTNNKIDETEREDSEVSNTEHFNEVDTTTEAKDKEEAVSNDAEAKENIGSTITEIEITNEELENTKVIIGNTYKLNEYITDKSKMFDNGDYRLSFTNVQETEERTDPETINADKVIVLTYEYQNISIQDDFYTCYCWFKVKDSAGNELEMYPISRNNADRINIGQQGIGKSAYALNSDTNKVIVEYYGESSFDNLICKFELEW